MIEMKTILVTCILSLWSVVAALAQKPGDPRDVGQKWFNINYAGDTLRGHRLDIYLPATGDGPFPVIVAIAGSAWFSDNSKPRAYNIGSSLLSQGFAIVAINHRSSRKAIFPAQINDVKGAIRFIRANAAKYKLDTSFLGITGDSSGGHLSALAGTSGAITAFTVGSKTLSIEGNIGGNLNQSSRVDAVVDWYGPTIFQKIDSCGSSFRHDAKESPESILIGGLIQENDDLCALANPITYIDKNDPAVLIIHGDADNIVPHCQSIFLMRELSAKGVKNELIIVPKGVHGGEITWQDRNVEKMIAFFNEARKNKMARN